MGELVMNNHRIFITLSFFAVFINALILPRANSGGDPTSIPEFIIVTARDQVGSNEIVNIDGNRADGRSGLILNEPVKLRIQDISYCRSPDGDYSFYMARYIGNGIYECIFEVYQKTADSFKSVKKFVEKNKLSLYTSDFSRGVMWIPASCQYNLKKCQIELNFLRDNNPY
ncbi:MAG: hypothetical protein ABW090_03220 [Sedimenticola sp.]